MPLYDMYCTNCGYEGEQLAKPDEKVACPHGCESMLERAAVQAFAVSTSNRGNAVALRGYMFIKDGVPQRSLLLPQNAFHEHIRRCPVYSPSDSVVNIALQHDTRTGEVRPLQAVVAKEDGSGYAIHAVNSDSFSQPASSTEKPN